MPIRSVSCSMVGVRSGSSSNNTAKVKTVRAKAEVIISAGASGHLICCNCPELAVPICWRATRLLYAPICHRWGLICKITYNCGAVIDCKAPPP